MEITNNFVDINTIKPNKSESISSKNINSETALKEVCNDFEAFFMNHLLETSLKSSKIAGEGTGSEIIKGMYTDAVSKTSAGTMGISDMLYKFLSEKKS